MSRYISRDAVSRPTRAEVHGMRYLLRSAAAGRWDSGPETGAGHVWLCRDGEFRGEPVFKMRGNEAGFEQAARLRQDQAELIAWMLNNAEFLLDAAETRCEP